MVGVTGSIPVAPTILRLCDYCHLMVLGKFRGSLISFSEAHRKHLDLFSEGTPPNVSARLMSHQSFVQKREQSRKHGDGASHIVRAPTV